jgi:hypothetical protein
VVEDQARVNTIIGGISFDQGFPKETTILGAALFTHILEWGER